MTTTLSFVRSALPTRVTGWQKVVGIAGLAVVVWAGGDLIDVATADSFGPGGPAGSPGADHRPPGATTPAASRTPGGPQDSPVPSPSPGGGAHDPSSFDHG